MAKLWDKPGYLAISHKPLAMSRLYCLSLFPILQELLQADVGERMVEHLLDYRRRAGGDVGAQLGRFDDVNGMTAAGDEDFRRELVVAVDRDDLANELHAVGGDVVEAADERADERRARLRRQQRLRAREAQRDV